MFLLWRDKEIAPASLSFTELIQTIYLESDTADMFENEIKEAARLDLRDAIVLATGYRVSRVNN
jgi:hypothetical protein